MMHNFGKEILDECVTARFYLVQTLRFSVKLKWLLVDDLACAMADRTSRYGER